MTINTSEHYSFSEGRWDDSGNKIAFVFKTDKGSTHTVELTNLVDQFPFEVFYISLISDPENPTFDPKVMVTVGAIFKLFLSLRCSALWYVCDNSDKRGHKRSQCFLNTFESFNANKDFECIAWDYNHNEDKAYLGLMFNKCDPKASTYERHIMEYFIN